MTPDLVVLGGTFDPVHNGHLSIVEQVLDRSGAGSAVLVPAATPNLREPAVASPEVRLAMLRAAVDGDPRLAVDDLELRRGGVSYTVDTLAELRRRHPDSAPALLLGADAARRIAGWDRAEELLRSNDFIVVNRSGEPPVSDAELHRLGFVPERTRRLTVDSPAVSATEIRARIAAGLPIDHLVPAAVASIIRRERLYSDPGSRA
jgi:nicotinate-nucleotide adenylyltransferase